MTFIWQHDIQNRQTLLIPPLDDMLLIYPKDRRGEEKREEKRRKLHEYQSLQVHNIYKR